MGSSGHSARRTDFLSRVFCLLIAAAFGVGALLAEGSSSLVLFWALAVVALTFVVLALVGPKSVRHGLLAAFPPLS
jgi:membrane protein YdbS with pleckstrin-like domain